MAPNHAGGKIPPELTDQAPDGTVIPEYARVPTTCKMFGLSPSGIRRLVLDDKIRQVKLGRTSLIDCDSLRAYLAALK